MTHNQHHIIRELRSMLPQHRTLDMREARVVAERQALALLKLLGITRPAVDVGLLTQLPRLRVVIDADLHNRHLSGASGWQDGRWIIVINKKDSLTRRRFTLAHEFKHILDAPNEKRTYAKLGLDDEDRQRCMEEVADYFAASLLMPRLFIVHALRNDVRDVHRLAALFMVSPVAMSRRLRDLGLAIETPEGQDPVLRFFRKAAISVPHRRLRSATGGDDRAIGRMAVEGQQTAHQPPADGPPAIAIAADADEPCQSALSLLTIPEASGKLRVNRWLVYRLILTGQLETIKIGNRRLVPCKAIQGFIERQAAEERV